jgi:hypothetical protein
MKIGDHQPVCSYDEVDFQKKRDMKLALIYIAGLATIAILFPQSGTCSSQHHDDRDDAVTVPRPSHHIPTSNTGHHGHHYPEVGTSSEETGDELVTRVFSLKLGPQARDPTVYWQVDYGKQEVKFELSVPPAHDGGGNKRRRSHHGGETDEAETDWIGFGFSDRGDLEGADLCVLWVDWRGEFNFDVSIGRNHELSIH